MMKLALLALVLIVAMSLPYHDQMVLTNSLIVGRNDEL
jgi:hypothetical protein